MAEGSVPKTRNVAMPKIAIAIAMRHRPPRGDATPAIDHDSLHTPQWSITGSPPIQSPGFGGGAQNHSKGLCIW